MRASGPTTCAMLSRGFAAIRGCPEGQVPAASGACFGICDHNTSCVYSLPKESRCNRGIFRLNPEPLTKRCIGHRLVGHVPKASVEIAGPYPVRFCHCRQGPGREQNRPRGVRRCLKEWRRKLKGFNDADHFVDPASAFLADPHPTQKSGKHFIPGPRRRVQKTFGGHQRTARIRDFDPIVKNLYRRPHTRHKEILMDNGICHQFTNCLMGECRRPYAARARGRRP